MKPIKKIPKQPTAAVKLVQMPAGVTEKLDADYASSRAAEQELDQLAADMKSGKCGASFALARAFQLGATFQREVSERAARKAAAAGAVG
jgi:hypothetical protein